MLIGLVGEKGGGKGTVADYLVSEYKAVKLRFSGVLDDLLLRLGLAISRNNEINLALSLREKFGNGVIAKALAQDFNKSGEKLGVLDGIRYWEELEVFQKLPGFLLVYVKAPLEKRFERNYRRGEKKDDNISLEEFKKVESAPTEVYIKKIAAKADVLIDNSGTLDDLYAKIEEKIGQKIKS
ncbi:MAG: AAA family ATPase [Patescibacteria group bacterium]